MFVTDASIADGDESVDRAFSYVSQKLLTKADTAKHTVELNLVSAFLPL